MHIASQSSIAIVFSTLVMLLSGCGTAGLNLNFKAEKHQKESAENPVEQIIPVWREAEGPGTDQHSVSRGFNGQVYFITQERGLPSEIDGSIRIYVFDDQGAAEELSKPIHQFDFNASTWNAHLVMSKLGPAYSVFIPYTRPGRNAAECAVRIRYTPANGSAPIFSQMVTITMPGINPKSESNESAQKVAIPSLTKRGPPALRKVTQVSASGDLVDLQRVQHAGYETTQQQTAARVRLSDYETTANETATTARRAFQGDNIPDESEDAVTDAVLTRLASQIGSPDVESSDVSAPPEEEDGEQTVKTYTIPLDN